MRLCWWMQPEKKAKPHIPFNPDYVVESSEGRKKLAKYLENHDPKMLEFIKTVSREFAVEGKKTPIEKVEYRGKIR